MKPLVALFFLLLSAGATAQHQDTATLPFVLVDTFSTELKLLVINPKNIESINVFKDSTALATFGAKARHGAIIIKTKEDTKLLRTNQLLDKFNIPAADRSLRICLNKRLVSQPQMLLLEESEIQNVEITTDRQWVHPEEANSTERFINITTTTRT